MTILVDIQVRGEARTEASMAEVDSVRTLHR
jgi:hypothetical protein